MRIISSRSALACAAAVILTAVTACTGDDDPEAAPSDEETLEVAYPESLFPASGPAWCQDMPELVPDNGFMPGTSENDLEGSDVVCTVSQADDRGTWRVSAWVTGYWNEGDAPAAEMFASTTEEPSIPIEGLGEAAALTRIDAVRRQVYGQDVVWDFGLVLAVQEGNLLLEFAVRGVTIHEEPTFRFEGLALTADTAIRTAEAYLTELGAENHALEAPQATLDEGITALPDLCSELDLGMDPAADQSDWAIDGDSMDGCHWADGEANLWLSAEAVGPLPAAGLSAEDFATWWAGALPSAEGKALDLGDQASIVELDPETADVEVPAADFVVRIGNIVLQGRFQDGTAEPGAAAEEFVSVITEQAQSLLPAG